MDIGVELGEEWGMAERLSEAIVQAVKVLVWAETKVTITCKCYRTDKG
jgi:hypothetical protein